MSRRALLGALLAALIGGASGGSCAVAAASETHLYWPNTGANTLGRANLDGSGADESFISSECRSVAVDRQHIYWSTSNGIGRANLDGSGVEASFITGITGISGVAVSGQHIYWSGGGGNIGRSNLDGSGVEPHFITGINGGAVGGVAVSEQYIYWTNFWDSSIGRANLDGSGLQQDFISKIHTPTGLAIDSQHVYWAITYENKIGRANLDGSEVNLGFITGLSSEENEEVGVAVDSRYLYWTNPTTGTIGRANLDGSEVNQSFITGAHTPLGIAIDVPEIPPTVTTAGASGVSTSAATLNGTVNPNGLPGTAYFQYGVTAAYGQSTAGQSIGAAEVASSFAAAVSGLSPGTTYHFRVVAENAAGTSYGADQTFTAAAASSSSASSTSSNSMPPGVASAQQRSRSSPRRIEATMNWTFGWTKRYTVVKSLVVHEVPAGADVEVTCHGAHCPFARDRAAGASHRHCRKRHCRIVHSAQGSDVSLAQLFGGRHLGVGAQISVMVLKPGWIGKVFLFTTRSGEEPSARKACLAPGSSQPGRGC